MPSDVSLDKHMTTLKLEDWIGKTADVTDTVQLSVCKKMAATVGMPCPESGGSLPPLWHWLFFHELSDSAELGQDGHPVRGGFLPPVELPRRMWAGGRLRFFSPMKLGATIHRHSRITRVTSKQGKSGELCFVTVLHTFTQADASAASVSAGAGARTAIGTVLMEEEHDIVYREALPIAQDSQSVLLSQKDRDTLRSHITASSTLITPLTPRSQTITPSVSVLFRYSALTFNSHRIHYDREYCQSEEHYAGLVFHGPLTATLMAGFAQNYLQQPLISFEFRALAPLLDIDTFTIDLEESSQGVDVFARKADGTLAMQASAATVT